MNNVININRDLDFGFEGSKADFRVATHPLTVKADALGELPVDSHKAVVRVDQDGSSPRTIGVVGEKYKLLHNKHFFCGLEKAMNKTLERDKTKGFKVVTKTSFDGAYTERRYVFPGFGGKVTTNTGWSTKVGFQVISWNGYDGGSAAGMACGMIDFFCKNGMVTGENVDMTKKRHTSGLSVQNFVPVLEDNILRMQDTIRTYNQMAQADLNVEQAELFLEKMFSERRAERMKERLATEIAERGNNVFALHSALTYYASHNSDEFAVRNTGADNEAKTLANRRDEVAKMVKSAPFKALMEAA